MSNIGDAQNAILAEVKRQAEAIATARVNIATEAKLLKDLATAYRLAAGGPQPGVNDSEDSEA